MPTVMHFEIPADDTGRAIKFYTELFGWKFEEIPKMDYWLITTSGEKAVNGGMMKREKPGQTVTNYIDISSVEEYVKKVEKLGGRVVAPKQAVRGMGYFAICSDTENNVFGIWEADKNAK